MDGKAVITWVVLGVVGLLILGALGQGSGSYLYNLEHQNTTKCAYNGDSYDVNHCIGANATDNTNIGLIAGMVIPIIFFVAVVMRFI